MTDETDAMAEHPAPTPYPPAPIEENPSGTGVLADDEAATVDDDEQPDRG